jgi:hypothetical protein
MSAATGRPPDDRWAPYRALGDDEFPNIGRVHEVPIVPFTDGDLFSFERPVAAILELPHEMLAITELSPCDGTFVGKRIQLDGSIAPYPMVTYWRQTVVRIPATIPALADYLEQARKRNICLIRGAPARLGAGENTASESRWRSRQPRLHRRADQTAFLRHRWRGRQLAGRSRSRGPENRGAVRRAVGISELCLVFLGRPRSQNGNYRGRRQKAQALDRPD